LPGLTSNCDPLISTSQVARNTGVSHWCSAKINFLENMEDLCTENYATLLGKIDDQNKWRFVPCLCIGTFNIIMKSSLPKSVNRFNAITIEILTGILITLQFGSKIWIIKQRS
jgi:hypothetical protein